MCGDSLELGPSSSVSCQMKTAMLTAMNSTVTNGNRSVGMLSLSGSTRAANLMSENRVTVDEMKRREDR